MVSECPDVVARVVAAVFRAPKDEQRVICKHVPALMKAGVVVMAASEVESNEALAKLDYMSVEDILSNLETLFRLQLCILCD